MFVRRLNQPIKGGGEVGPDRLGQDHRPLMIALDECRIDGAIGCQQFVVDKMREM
ncbi:MAG: hypothetical protein HC822_17680 [Oscillochloris sp.]|nr:hypothetical protein [Oscillochloris sp.]